MDADKDADFPTLKQVIIYIIAVIIICFIGVWIDQKPVPERWVMFIESNGDTVFYPKDTDTTPAQARSKLY